MSGEHFLIVTIDPDDDEHRDGSIECTGVTDACRTWWECREEHTWDRDEFEFFSDAVYEGEDLHHGVEHRVIDGMIMTPSEQCLGQALDSAWESAREAAEGLAPGRYPCHMTYEGDEYVCIELAAVAPAGSGEQE
jgi:hypothetical protein